MKDIDSLFRSFVYAVKGFAWMVSHERNFRIHLVCLGYMIFFLCRYDFFVVSEIEASILVIISALVIGSEMINTGIEKADDAFSREEKYAIKVSKDVAAGAVLVFAVASVVIGVFILWQPAAFEALFAHYKAHIWKVALLVFSFVLSLLFIFKFNFKEKGKEK
ncbi:MAG: diacylglycerol kinase family protein [Clostridia bacterium]|nr:diacylglycerol kinase family protein [Clostridia bacterium]